MSKEKTETTESPLDNSAAVKVPKTPITKEKVKVLGFVNWASLDLDENDKPILRSTKGFSLLDNKFLTKEDKALLQLARDNGGTAIIDVELRIVLHQEKPEVMPTAGIKVKNAA